ncbi:MAG: hypothetical protein V3R80_04840 [Candidatus Tectomicrobia bacterium]
MAEKLDPKELVTIEEVAVSSMWEKTILHYYFLKEGHSLAAGGSCDIAPEPQASSPTTVLALLHSSR